MIDGEVVIAAENRVERRNFLYTLRDKDFHCVVLSCELMQYMSVFTPGRPSVAHRLYRPRMRLTRATHSVYVARVVSQEVTK